MIRAESADTHGYVTRHVCKLQFTMCPEPASVKLFNVLVSSADMKISAAALKAIKQHRDKVADLPAVSKLVSASPWTSWHRLLERGSVVMVSCDLFLLTILGMLRLLLVRQITR